MNQGEAPPPRVIGVAYDVPIVADCRTDIPLSTAPLYYRTPWTEDPSIPDIPEGAKVVHLPTVAEADGVQRATCHCDLDMIDPRCVVPQ